MAALLLAITLQASDSDFSSDTQMDRLGRTVAVACLVFGQLWCLIMLAMSGLEFDSPTAQTVHNIWSDENIALVPVVLGVGAGFGSVINTFMKRSARHPATVTFEEEFQAFECARAARKRKQAPQGGSARGSRPEPSGPEPSELVPALQLTGLRVRGMHAYPPFPGGGGELPGPS